MKQNKLKSNIRKFAPQKRRAVAEVISSLLLVAITVVGAVILTTFLDESFISGGLSASGSDSTVKSIKLIAYDTRDGGDLMGLQDLTTTSILQPVDQKLCRASCSSQPNANPVSPSPGTEFLVIQIENQSVNPIFLHNVWLGNATHAWDPNTAGEPLDVTADFSTNGGYPGDGKFSIFPIDCDIKIANPCTTTNPAHYPQNQDNQIQSGKTVNLLLKLDPSNPDIQLSKTIRAQFNIGANQLAEFLIESGSAQ
jgi:flagellin-like protein